MSTEPRPQAVLVTGASSGFGAALTTTLAARGHTVAASMRDPAKRNAPAMEMLSAIDGVSVVELDVSDDDSVAHGVADAAAKLGTLDAVVNNAGFRVLGLMECVSVELAQRLFTTNVFGVLRVNRAVLPHMRNRGRGVLVHLSSSSGRRTLPFAGIYAASKYALEAIAETYRYELAPLGIDSVIVEPGPFGTDIDRNTVQADDSDRLRAYDKLANEMLKVTGFRMPGNPQRVADQIANLIETPTGQRPLRTLITDDDTHALSSLNAASDVIARNALTQLKLDRLLDTTPSQ